MVFLQQYVKFVQAQNFCSMTIYAYRLEGQCNTPPPDAVGTIYADGQCRTVVTNTTGNLLPGNYRAECTAGGKIRFVESDCVYDTCSLPAIDDGTGLCERKFNTISSLYRTSEYDVEEKNATSFTCTKLNNTAFDGVDVTFVVFGDCSDPGCLVNGVVNPLPPTESPTISPSALPSPSPTKKPSPTSSPSDNPSPRPTEPPTRRPVPAPTPRPTGRPVPAPTPPPTRPPWDASCFSGQSLVEVEGQGSTRMDALKIGDAVLTADGSYSKVYSFGHYDSNTKTEYLQIQVATDKYHHPLEITSEHLLYKHILQTKKKEAVPAGSIKVGDWIVAENGAPVKVSSIAKVSRVGAYAPLTTTGNVVVNSILASNYMSRMWVKDVPGQMLHYLQHGGTLPYRIYCTVVGCHGEIYNKETGFSPWVMFWYHIEQWQLGLHPILQALFFMVGAVPATLVVVVGMLLTVPISTTFMHLMVCLAGYYIWKKAPGKHGSMPLSVGFNKELNAGSKH